MLSKSAHVAAYPYGRPGEKFLVLLNHKGKWMCPGGMNNSTKTKVESNEDCMLREFQEETGLGELNKYLIMKETAKAALYVGELPQLIDELGLKILLTDHVINDKLSAAVHGPYAGKHREIFGWGWAEYNPENERWSVDLKNDYHHILSGKESAKQNIFRGGTITHLELARTFLLSTRTLMRVRDHTAEAPPSPTYC